jgi:hypothetical protein
MPVQAYVDDSGGKGQSKNFVLAGLVSNSERWVEFSLEWRRCLDQYPRIEIFKMREAASLTGAFHRFTEEQRDSRLRELAQIINRYVEFAIWTMIDLDAHAQTWAKLTKPRSEVYFWPFHTLILGTCFDLWEECKWREPFEIIFDEQLIFGERARRWYPLIRELMRSTYPEEFTILPLDPMFGKDDDRLPIQAADLWAWCLRKNTDDPGAKSFEWLLEEMPNVSQSNYCNYYDLERMSSVLEESARIAQRGQVPSELMSIYEIISSKKK